MSGSNYGAPLLVKGSTPAAMGTVPKTSSMPFIAMIGILGGTCLGTYVYTFLFKKGSMEQFWMGIPKDVITLQMFTMALAAVGYLVWSLVWVAGVMNGFVLRPTVGSLTYELGTGIPYFCLYLQTFVFLFASCFWSELARHAFISTDHHAKGMYTLGTSLVLVLVALSAILMVAGTFESDSNTWYATLGVLLIAQQCVLLDGIGWNARLIWQYLWT
eukprot:g3555.t1